MDNWRVYAACRDIGTEAFFSEDDDRSSGNSSEMKLAKRICEGCPVRRECLSTALRYEGDANKSDRHGIWGGLGPTQRANLWKQLKARKGENWENQTQGA